MSLVSLIPIHRSPIMIKTNNGFSCNIVQKKTTNHWTNIRQVCGVTKLLSRHIILIMACILSLLEKSSLDLWDICTCNLVECFLFLRGCIWYSLVHHSACQHFLLATLLFRYILLIVNRCPLILWCPYELFCLSDE